MNGSKVVPDAAGNEVRCLGCPSVISAEDAVRGDGYCQACRAVLEVGETVQKHRSYASDTKLGRCAACGSRNLVQTEEQLSTFDSIAAILILSAVLFVVLGLIIFAIPMVGILVIWAILKRQAQTLKGIYRECRYCGRRWEVIATQPSRSPSQPTT